MTGQSQTLYRKWRSQTFADLVGQDAVTQTLRQAVKNDRLTHAYLFCGPRGTGKTSSARLLAKMVNCEALRDGEPCNDCLPCREITEGRSTDVYEIDAASNRGIDEIRDLRDRVRIMSATGRTRLYIVDECFRYEEKVTLADGSRVPIGKLVESEWQGEVLSYNEKTGEIEPKPIVRHMKKPTIAPTVQVRFDNNRAITCTINHKFYTPQGQICAGHLQVGQFVYTNRERITKSQRAVIMGAALGDGHVSLTGSAMRGRLRIVHGVAQKEYLEYKAQLLGTLVRSAPYYNAGIGTYSKTGTFAFSTLSRPEIAEIHRQLYHDGVKYISRAYLDQIDDLGLALWYLDDGSLATAKNPYTRKDGSVTHYPNSRSTFSTHCFTASEAQVMCNWFAERWGIEARYSATAKGPVIWLTLAGTELLHQIIAPYVPLSMEYKLLPRYRGQFQMPTDDAISSGLAVSVVSSVEQVPAPDFVYNIEVADNHNYFVRDMLVANCHMLTVEAFNALLKTLEEPPPHVIFVLATTEAHKVPATVVSRCQRFDFRRISLRDIIGRLNYVATQEELRADAGAIELLARAAQGGMRDALSLLDQARAFSGDAIATEAVRAMLGMADPALVQELIVFVATSDTAAGLHRINELAQSGVDLRQLTGQIAELWRQIMLARAGADIATMLDLAPEDAAALKALGERFTLAMLTECARIFARNDGGARSQVVPQLALELAFLDCVAAVHQPGMTSEVLSQPQRVPAIAAPRPAIIQEAAAAQPYAPSVALPTPPAPSPVPIVTESAPTQPAPEFVVLANENGKAPPVVELPATFVTVAPVQETQALPPPSGDNKTEAAEVFEYVRNQWELIKQACKTVDKARGHSVKALLDQARPVLAQPSQPVSILITVDFDWHLNKLSQPENRLIVEKAITAIIERPCQVQFISKDAAASLGHVTPATPSASSPSMPAPASQNGAAHSPVAPSAPAAAPVPQSAPAPRDNSEPDIQAQVQHDPVVLELQREYGARVINVKAANS